MNLVWLVTDLFGNNRAKGVPRDVEDWDISGAESVVWCHVLAQSSLTRLNLVRYPLTNFALR